MTSAVSMSSNSGYENIPNSEFKGYLNEMFQSFSSDRPIIIDYTQPYDGRLARLARLGTYPAEIYTYYHQDLAKILLVIQSLGLSTRGENEKKESDIITSNAGGRGGITQIIFTTESALKKFKHTVIKEMKEGIVPIEVLFRALPSLKDLITGSENDRSFAPIFKGIKYRTKDEESAIKAEEIIKSKIESLDFFGGDFFKREGKEIFLLASACDALVKFCKPESHSGMAPLEQAGVIDGASRDFAVQSRMAPLNQWGVIDGNSRVSGVLNYTDNSIVSQGTKSDQKSDEGKPN